MGKYRRKHYAIDKLPEDVKNDVDEMIKADFTYSDIVEYNETDKQPYFRDFK